MGPFLRHVNLFELIKIAIEYKSVVLFSHVIVEVLHVSVTTPTATTFLLVRSADTAFVPEILAFITNIVISYADTITVIVSFANWHPTIMLFLW